MTMFEGRTHLAKDVVDEVRKHFPGQVFAAIVPRSIRSGRSAFVWIADCLFMPLHRPAHRPIAPWRRKLMQAMAPPKWQE
jgi:hypothetical protein